MSSQDPQNQHQVLATIKELKETFFLSIPLISSQLIYASSGFIGTAFVAHLGADALAASVLVSMMWISLSVLFFGMLNSVSILVSHQYGANQPEAIRQIMGQAFKLGLVVCLLSISILATMPLFLHFTTQPPAVIHFAIQYMHALLFTIPGLVILVILEQFLAGINRIKIVLRISLLVVPIEIPLIYLLIFGKLGFPACGVSGVGYGFAITYTLTAISLIFYLWRGRAYQKYGLFRDIFALKLSLFKNLLRIGLPMGLMQLIEVGTFTIATFWVAQFGTIDLAAHQIAMQYLGFSITIVFAMAQAVTIRVGHAVGRQDLSAVRVAISSGMLLNSCFVIVIAIAFYFFPNTFLRLDIDIANNANHALRQAAASLLGVSALLICWDNFRIVGFGALRGLKDTTYPMYVSFFAFGIVGLGSAYYFGFILHGDAKGIWLGLTTGIASGAIILFIRVRSLLKRIDLKQLMT